MEEVRPHMKKVSTIGKYTIPVKDNIDGPTEVIIKKQQHRMPIGSRTTSFNFVLYEILKAHHKSNSPVSLLIYS
jgi:hypothetical protein